MNSVGRLDLTPFIALWNLKVEGRPAAGNDILYVRRGVETLVLKGLDPVEDEWRMAAVLTHWGGAGAVKLIAEAPGAVLIERAMPGGELADLALAGDDDRATEAFCEVFAQLNKPAPEAGGFRRIEDWGKGFARVRDRGLAVGFTAARLDAAEALFHELCASQGPPILLHGDLHHHNIVADAARGWLAIDPKGVLGEAEYEVGALLRNPQGTMDHWNAEAQNRRIDILAERLGFDRQRLRGWAFAQAVLGCLWGLESGHYEGRWMGMADATAQVAGAS